MGKLMNHDTSRMSTRGRRAESGGRLGLRSAGRFGMGLLLLLSVFTGIVTLGLTTAATPASATTITQCIDPASGGTSQTFVEGTAATYSVECEGESGVSGTTAYPSAITISSGSLPSSGDLTLATACTQSTSGSGATEQYILTCKITGTPSSADAGSYPLKFTPTASPNGGAATASGTLTLSVVAPTVTCIDPASGGTATTFHEGITTPYTVECESQSGIASVSAYPTSIAIASGALPGDAGQTFATSTSSSPACTTGTSGSSTTEEYILECNLSGTPTSSDGGTYPFTFTATGVGGYGSVTSGTLTVTVAPITPTCIDPATAGTATTFYEGSAGSYTVECEAQSGVSGTTAYPSSITVNSGSLPADGSPTFATSTSSSPACTTGTSGSGATEEYILECALADTPTSADTGSYPLTFTATGPGGLGSVTSGTLTVTVTPPSTTCSTPAAAGTSVSWVDGTAETETVICYSQGFATANAGNYPSSITVNSGSLPSGSSEATSLSSSPACTTATSGSGTAEEYELECKITDTPTSANNGTYHVTFLAAGGSSGAPSITSGTLTIAVTQPAPSWATDGTTDGNYFSAIKGVPFCEDIEVSAGQVGPSGTNPGSTASLPLTSLTAGATPPA